MQNGELMKLSIFNEEALGEERQDLDKLVNSFVNLFLKLLGAGCVTYSHI